MKFTDLQKAVLDIVPDKGADIGKMKGAYAQLQNLEATAQALMTKLQRQAFEDAGEDLDAWWQGLEAEPDYTSSPKLWVWNWKGGGFNSCVAADREEALEMARQIGAHGVPLVPDEASLKETTNEELDKLYADTRSLVD